MLCKTTMRAALAHVLGTVGILGAFGAGAQTATYAAETLTGDGPYSIMATEMGSIVMDVTVDTILEGENYLVLDFGAAELTRQLTTTGYTEVDADTPGTAGDSSVDPATMPVQPVVGNGRGFRFYTVTRSTTGAGDGIAGAIVPGTQPAVERAFQGDEGHSTGVYKIGTDATDLPIDTHIRLELGTDLGAGGIVAADAAGYLAVPGGTGSYSVDVYLYDNLGDARSAARGSPPASYVFHGSSSLFSVASKLNAPMVTGHAETSDVAEDRGAFLEFVTTDMNHMGDVGVLATITVTEKDAGTAAMPAFLAPNGRRAGDVITGAKYTVSSDIAGAFKFGNGADKQAKITGDDPETDEVEDAMNVVQAGLAKGPKAFMVSTDTSCMDTPLQLTVPGEGGAAMDISPLAETNPTFAEDATGGYVNVTGAVGTRYFCVLVSANEVRIPALGDKDEKNAYMVSVTPTTAAGDGAAGSGAGGAIDRNGTSVNVTYLSVHPAYNQRLVIVNRGDSEADYWMDTFQTEAGTMVMNELRGTVGARSRTVIRVQDDLMVNQGGMTRASGTLNLTAPDRNIDVMTLQVHPGTGQIDTTIYQHDAD